MRKMSFLKSVFFVFHGVQIKNKATQVGLIRTVLLLPNLKVIGISSTTKMMTLFPLYDDKDKDGELFFSSVGNWSSILLKDYGLQNRTNLSVTLSTKVTSMVVFKQIISNLEKENKIVTLPSRRRRRRTSNMLRKMDKYVDFIKHQQNKANKKHKLFLF